MAGKGSLAKEVRAGLEASSGSPAHLSLVKGGVAGDPLEELYFRKPIRQHVKEFACVMSLAMLVIAGFQIVRHDRLGVGIGLLIASIAMLYVGYRHTALLRPVWKGWMTFAEKIGAVMSVVVLSIAWFIAMVPIAVIARACRARVMDLSLDSARETYWESRDPKFDDFQLLKRQF